MPNLNVSPTPVNPKFAVISDDALVTIAVNCGAKALGVYAFLEALALKNGDGTVDESPSFIAGIIDITVLCLSRCIKDLEEMGFVERQECGEDVSKQTTYFLPYSTLTFQTRRMDGDDE